MYESSELTSISVNVASLPAQVASPSSGVSVAPENAYFTKKSARTSGWQISAPNAFVPQCSPAPIP